MHVSIVQIFACKYCIKIEDSQSKHGNKKQKVLCISLIYSILNSTMLSRRLLRIKVVKSLYSHFQSSEVSLINSEKEFQKGNNKCYELYLLLLGLVVEVADYAQSRMDIASAKMRPTEEDLNPNRRFVDNKVVAILRNSQQLNDLRVRRKSSWGASGEGIFKDLYEQMLQTPYFKLYMKSSSGGFAEDRKMVLDFYRKHVEDNELIEQVLEAESIFWIDDLEYALGFVIATLSTLKTDDADIEVLPMYKNDDDREFGQILFRKALVNSNQYFECIDTLTRNWDFERIAFMDRIVMLAALAEFTQFPSIPIKVTLDEYIEIAKDFSTPSSGQFVNGILDKAVEMLTEKGLIIKSGRGLMETSVKDE